MVSRCQWFIFALSLMLSIVGCTRNSSQESKVRMSLKLNQDQDQISAQTSSEPKLFKIFVNIRGPGMPLQFWTWDGCDTCTPPEFIELEVPAGPDRLIQYLGVFESVGGDRNLIFKYAEQKQALVAGLNAVSLEATQHGEPTGVETNIMGQYVSHVEGGFGYGPTGKLDVLFSPESGAPGMLIESAEMFNGWTKLFALPGVPFTYVLRGRSNDIGVTYSSLQEIIDGNPVTNLLKVYTPSKFFYKDAENTLSSVEGGELFVGFFGPAADVVNYGVACYSATAPANLYVDDTNDPPIPLGYEVNASGPVANKISVRRGDNFSSTACSSGSLFQNRIDVNFDFANDGLFESAGFYGPFKKADISIK